MTRRSGRNGYGVSGSFSLILLSGDLDFPLSILGVDEAIILEETLFSGFGVNIAHVSHQHLTVEAEWRKFKARNNMVTDLLVQIFD